MALVAAVVLAAAGTAIAGILVATGAVGPLGAPLFAAMLFLAWEYSAQPLRLHSTGLGELDTAVVVTILVPFTGFHLQAGELAGAATLAWSVLPLALLQLAMLLAIELPDAAGGVADRHDGGRAGGRDRVRVISPAPFAARQRANAALIAGAKTPA